MPFDMPHKHKVVLDFETKSEISVKDVGAWKYAEHPSTEILSAAYDMPNSYETKLWAPPLPFPQELIDLVNDPDCYFEAHNAQFEMAIWLHILHRRHDIPMPSKWMDTQATCAYRSLPLALDKVGAAVNLDIQKDARGKYLLNQLSKPRKPIKKERDAFKELGIPEAEWPILWREDWDLLEELYGYNITDTKAEHQLGDAIGDLTIAEYNIWVMDQRINYRGMGIDVDAVDGAISIMEHMFGLLEAELIKLTDGKVHTGSQRDKMLAWLQSVDVPIENLTADSVKDWIENIDEVCQGADHDPRLETARRVLEIRQTLGSSSVKKLYKFRMCVGEGDRIRGLLQYHGAGTGRWAGRLVQPQNFPRGCLEDFVDMLGMGEADVMELLMDTVRIGGSEGMDALNIIFGSAINALVTSLRGMFKAAPGKIYHVADFSAIEAVVTAWLAGEKWKVKAFEAIQRGEGYNGAPDMYCATASKILGRLITKKDKKERQQFGKVPELAFGYQGGVGAWYNFDPKTEMSEQQIDDVKVQWRKEHPAIAGEYIEREDGGGYFAGGLWKSLEGAAVECLHLDRPVAHGSIIFEPVYDKAGKWLSIVLPNKRKLWYYDPKLLSNVTPWGKTQWQVSYMGKDNKRGGAWGRVTTYGGMITENIVQAISRDLMSDAMLRVEKVGYSIIVTIHDEIISEDDEDFGSQQEFEDLMAVVPDWAAGCPVGVAGWQGYRYRKD